MPKALDSIMFNIHGIHADLTGSCLEILSEIIWNSDIGLNFVLNSLNNLKKEKNFSYRFFPFFEILKNSKNIIMIENVLAFLNSLVSSPEIEADRAILKTELISCGIRDIFNDLYEKVQNSYYKIVDCTFETI